MDRRFLAAALALGRSALGSTWPNPAVGAIVVNAGKAVGRGRTGWRGRPHAEPQALAMAGEKANGATLYVSLEPCAHHGATPPCTDSIVAAGVARVVTTMQDPDKRVAGRGLDRLRAAGIDVAAGSMTDEAGRAHAGYLMRQGHNRPHVTLKLAISADDAIGREGEPQVAVTAAAARRHVQALRARFDAILVGRSTVVADDPQLTCRLPGLLDWSPVRVILDSEGRLDGGRKVFDKAAPTWVFTADDAAHGVVPLPAEEMTTERTTQAGMSGEGADLQRVAVPRAEGGLDLAAVLKRLAGEGITRLLVEGGARAARSFLEADLVDEVMLFRSPVALGGQSVPALAGLPLSAVEASARFRRAARRSFGADTMTLYRRTA